ncbi:MAG: UvrD-helicase domain-containing protein [Eubacterium ventriosum]
MGKLRRQSLMDYDDQMVYAYTMLKTTPQVLEYFQNMYQYICVDDGTGYIKNPAQNY